MGTRIPNPGQTRKPEAQRYLTAAEYFLTSRNFADALKYALRARKSDPTDPDATRLVSIASVLSVPTVTPTQPDYYSILNLPQFESDTARIRSSFQNLTSILNPNTNPHPFSSEAFDVVLKAWSVLSNPIVKARFDEVLRMVLGSGGTFGSESDTFWTVCPYCYHVYEFEKVFEECCLRCANGKCRRGFHSVAIAPPPLEVVEKGHYLCPGFVPVGFGGGGDNGGNFWVPFGPPSMGVISEENGVNRNECDNGGYVIDVSDEELEVQDGKKTKVGCGDGRNGGVNVESRHTNGNGFTEGGVGREECVAWDSKKSMGRGVGIDRVSSHAVGEEMHLNVDGNECLETEIGGETSNGVNSGVEFFDGDGDVLVGVDFDLGDEEL